MKSHRKVLVLLALPFCGEAMACAEDSVALRYLAAIDAMDWSTMRSYLADDATYLDPTMTHFDRDQIELRGADDIVAFWSSSSDASGTSEISYTVAGCMETAGYHVVNLDISISVSGAFWNVARDVITIPGRVVSIVRVENERVTEHRDYVEYSAADRTVAELQSRYGVLDKQ